MHVLKWTFLFYVCVVIGLCQSTWSQSLQGSTDGSWIPISSQIGHRLLTRLGSAQHHLPSVQNQSEQGVYALGSGQIWYATHPNNEKQTVDLHWKPLGRYTPEIEWDEGEGVSVSGPFPMEILTQIERDLNELIEDSMESQGDENWVSEDTIQFIIETYQKEDFPAIDSPYFLSQIREHQYGVWVGTGSGVWGIFGTHLIPIVGSPTRVMSLASHQATVWVSTPYAIWKGHFIHDGQILETFDEVLNVHSSTPTQSSFEIQWTPVLEQNTSMIAYFDEKLWVLTPDSLYHLQSNQVLSLAPSPLGTPTYLYEGGDQLWSLVDTQLYKFDVQQKQWQYCQTFPYTPHSLHWSDGQLLAISQDLIWLVSEDCKNEVGFDLPLTQGLGFKDAFFDRGFLYAATTGGLFRWEPGQSVIARSISIQYLKRDLMLFPAFNQLYTLALKRNQLDQASQSYGKRPVLSALMPNVTLSYQTHPLRQDQRPINLSQLIGSTNRIGNRQLTLLQPVPEWRVFMEWTLSFDFLSRLFDPQQGSAYSEVQMLMDQNQDLPNSDVALETSFGPIDTWTDDTYTSQAQRLAQTMIALERRQIHRDREALRSRIGALYRERIQLTYKQWLDQDKLTRTEHQKLMIRLEEIDALLDAFTGYQFEIQNTMRSKRR